MSVLLLAGDYIAMFLTYHMQNKIVSGDRVLATLAGADPNLLGCDGDAASAGLVYKVVESSESEQQSGSESGTLAPFFALHCDNCDLCTYIVMHTEIVFWAVVKK